MHRAGPRLPGRSDIRARGAGGTRTAHESAFRKADRCVIERPGRRTRPGAGTTNASQLHVRWMGVLVGFGCALAASDANGQTVGIGALLNESVSASQTTSQATTYVPSATMGGPSAGAVRGTAGWPPWPGASEATVNPTAVSGAGALSTTSARASAAASTPGQGTTSTLPSTSPILSVNPSGTTSI